MEEQNSSEWQAPPPPEKIEAPEQAQMSEAATLGGIFIEPGRTFEDLRRKPRFILAGLIILIVITIFNALFLGKVGYERIVQDRLESNSRIQQLPADQKEQIIRQQTGPIFKAIGYAAPPIVVAILIFLGGLIYWLGANAMGGSARYLQGVSVWVYSWFPPFLVSMLANILVLFLKSVDDIDLATAQSGLIHANPGMFIDGKSQPVLFALLSSIDLFQIWGWVLAAIGLRIVAKISSGAAWAVVLILALVGVGARVVGALIFG
jgi:hypothetical protein